MAQQIHEIFFTALESEVHCPIIISILEQGGIISPERHAYPASPLKSANISLQMEIFGTGEAGESNYPERHLLSYSLLRRPLHINPKMNFWNRGRRQSVLPERHYLYSLVQAISHHLKWNFEQAWRVQITPERHLPSLISSGAIHIIKGILNGGRRSQLPLTPLTLSPLRIQPFTSHLNGILERGRSQTYSRAPLTLYPSIETIHTYPNGIFGTGGSVRISSPSATYPLYSLLSRPFTSQMEILNRGRRVNSRAPPYPHYSL
ncbi:hypothetical protein AVEN_105744-1 [Araneus ventricosus]|uniref:Uncharacterized protein n=1 Tax=Araneus ventricosus TaxID=182803 RepID=A0A4Y2LZU2_ARAVE|nr:hypothetical protein AVEN_105744-1 [Araneus ventricosus]